MSVEVNVQILTWLREHVAQVKKLAKDGHRPAKAVLDARSLYLRSIDTRDQCGARLTHDIHCYIHWLVSPAGEAALEGSTKHRARNEHRTPAQQRTAVNVARPATRNVRTNKNGRAVR